MMQETSKTYWKAPPNLVSTESSQPGETPGNETLVTGQFTADNDQLKAEPVRDLWSLNRRRFLEAAGFSLSLAAAAGCNRAPQVAGLPFVEQPPGTVPGEMRYYGSTCGGCSAGCGLLVGTRDGRPLKMEGMPAHPLSQGGLCGVGQAQPLELYDSMRLQGPLKGGPLKGALLKNGGSGNEKQPAQWTEIDLDISNQLAEIKRAGGAVRLVTPTITSPTLGGVIADFLEPFDDARHITFDAVSSSAILDAHEKTHRTRLLPHYRLDRAEVVVSFGADFLGTWISPVEYTAAWSQSRRPSEAKPSMSYHVQLESRLSLTGCNADRRFVIGPHEQSLLIHQLADRLAQLETPSDTPPSGHETKNDPQDAASKQQGATLSVSEAQLNDLAARLWQARAHALVLCDSQDLNTQVNINRINHLLQGYGQTLDIEHPSLQRQGNDRQVAELIDELQDGKVSALLVSGTDLTFNLPQREAMADAIKKVSLVISFAPRLDDFSKLAHYVCPDHHPLESWGDAEPIHALVTMVQPTIKPIHNTRSLLESLANWTGRSDSQYQLVRNYWQKQIFPQQQEQADFSHFWDRAVHDGWVQLPRAAVASQTFRDSHTADPMSTPLPSGQDGLALVLYQKVGMPDSQHAHNPWLQELPDPISKVTWDNYVCLSQKLAQEQSLENGDVVRIQVHDQKDAGKPVSLELPVFIQPGQHQRTVAIALAYGVPGTDRFAKVGPQWLESHLTVEPGQTVGRNAAPLIALENGALRYVRPGVTLAKTGRKQTLASTQEYHSIDLPQRVAPHGAERREIIQETSLAAFLRDPHAGQPEVHHHENNQEENQSEHQTESSQLWPEDHPKEGHWWGMMVDLNACTGCSACVIACQSENNVPVVGKDEVYRQRDMQWLRLDRYYAFPQGPESKSPSDKGSDRGPTDDALTNKIEVYHQPMMCQHCDNAPCETVCPVLATVHSDEGLNEQAYNRCVGTRYCANNCPYKVRRFNWFKYGHDDTLQNLVLNPEVTVRTRGVMEKCSMCVQRIEAGKISSSRTGEPLIDGKIQTACQQSCPAQAIIFGDMNDPDSRVSAADHNPRRYRVLEEFNFRPSVGYLRVVKNIDQETMPHDHPPDPKNTHGSEEPMKETHHG
jgi:Fe-S-cluster-containing dehydrogenase component